MMERDRIRGGLEILGVGSVCDLVCGDRLFGVTGWVLWEVSSVVIASPNSMCP